MPEESEEEFAALEHAAKLGDSEAATKVIAHYLPYWMRAAYGITYARNDGFTEPEDLVQEATLKLLSMWHSGQGPESNTRAYVTAMMRNAHSNKLRSPSAREASLEAFDAYSPLLTYDNVQEIDLGSEIEAVRRAFATLNQDHRTALFSAVIEGQKPADLVQEFERSAPAISNLLVRAKHALHRALLIDYLSTGASECTENAQQLPKRVHIEISQHADEERGLSHARSCETCRKNWRRFATVSATLGVLPLLTIGQWPVGATSVAVNRGEQSQTSAGSSARSLASSNLETVPQTMASKGASVSKVLASSPALIVGLALIVAAAVFFILRLTLDASPAREVTNAVSVDATSSFADGSAASSADQGSNPHDAEIDVWMEIGEGETPTTINSQFSVGQTEQWSLEAIRLGLSPGTEFRSASNGLQCSSERNAVQCVASQATDLNAPFVFAVTSRSPSGTFELELEAEAGGDRFSGRATGSW